MARDMKVEGMERISEMLEKAGAQAEAIAASGLYKGAGIVADAVNNRINGLKTEPFKYTTEGMRLPSPEEKAVLEDAAGIAKFDKSGSEVSTAVGVLKDGYAEMKTRSGSKTVPIPLIARSINSGTSFMQKQPFVRQAANQSKQKASEAIVSEMEKQLNKLLEA